jgi:NAD(P)H-quinone oxidoreductase subunit 5
VALIASHGAADAVARPSPGPHTVWLAWVGFSFLALYTLQAALAASPRSRLSRALYPWFYGGLYLDERVSRMIFRIWPPPRAANAQGQMATAPSAPWLQPQPTIERPVA